MVPEGDTVVKHRQRHIQRHNKIGRVHHLAQHQVADRAAQHIRLAPCHTLVLNQPVDHIPRRGFGILQQVRPVGGGYMEALAVIAAQRTGFEELQFLRRLAFNNIKAQGHIHRRFNPRPAQLTLPL